MQSDTCSPIVNTLMNAGKTSSDAGPFVRTKRYSEICPTSEPSSASCAHVHLGPRTGCHLSRLPHPGLIVFLEKKKRKNHIVLLGPFGRLLHVGGNSRHTKEPNTAGGQLEA
jgi:hypothetical protein